MRVILVPGTKSNIEVPSFCALADKPMAGFTLLEVLIVLVIIALLGTMASTSLLPSLEQRQTRKAAQQLADTLEFAQYQALLNGRPYGLMISTENYQILVYRQQSWQTPVEPDFQVQKTQGQLKLLHPNTAGVSITEPQPQIIFSPTGEPSKYDLVWQTGASAWHIKHTNQGKTHVLAWANDN